MISGKAILSWPVSAVTISVAIEATESDHQRLRGLLEAMSCVAAIEAKNLEISKREAQAQSITGQ
jgi:hypothetical protein